MEYFTGLVTGLSRVLDRLAGLCMVAVMGLVVSNVLLRVLFKKPILGTYEFVGFLTAAMISLALAYCAVQNAHIAVGFVVDRFSLRVQSAVETLTNITALFFWCLCAWHIGRYATSMIVSGVVSPTTQTPFYVFVYLVAFSLIVLSLVLLLRVAEFARKAVSGK